MDNASDFGSEDCGFESHRGRKGLVSRTVDAECGPWRTGGRGTDCVGSTRPAHGTAAALPSALPFFSQNETNETKNIIAVTVETVFVQISSGRGRARLLI